MTPLRSLNPLESMCSHLILCIVSPLPSFGDCQLGKGELSWWVSLSPLISFLSYFSGRAAATVSAPSPDRRMLNVSLSFSFSIRLVATTLSEVQEEKALKNLLLHVKWSSSGVSPGPSDSGVGSWACFLFLSSCSFLCVLFIFILHKTRGLWLPQSTRTILNNSRPEWNPRPIICLDQGSWSRWTESSALRPLGYK